MVTVPHKMFRFQRMLDYKVIGLQRFHCTPMLGYFFITDTVGPENSLGFQASLVGPDHFPSIFTGSGLAL